MALPQAAVSDLLEVLRTGEAVDLIRESVRTVLQELIEVEAAEVIGAARHERTDSRVNERNGSRPRTLSTKAGDIDLRIPSFAGARSSHSSWSRVGVSTRRCMRW